MQATRSNYTKAHGGAEVKYLEHFLAPARDRVLTDVLQSEHGAWFYRKRNRNMIVEVDGDVPVDDAFRWLTLGQIMELLRLDNVVNMDARTVLASAPVSSVAPRALSSDFDLLAWFTGERARHDVSARRMPLREVSGWQAGEYSVSRADGRFFRVVAVSVEGAGREVAGWTQPIIEPVAPGIVGFATASSTVSRTSWCTHASRAASSTPWSSRRPCSAFRRTTSTCRRSTARPSST